MIELFVKKFFGNIVKNHVYHFSYQLVHIKGFHAKGFHFLSIFSISFIFVKKGQNDRRAYSSKEVAFLKTIDGSVI